MSYLPLGPTGFPHRASASENPVAVIGHHQQDSTHIAANVITLGLTQGPLKVEASTFHGREPDEKRWNTNKGKPDSFATRLTVAPHKSFSAQFSAGRINNPEALDPTLDTVRTGGSVHHNIESSTGHVASSIIWGRNKNLKNGSRRVFNSYNFETTAKFWNRHWVWTRIENADRDRTLLRSCRFRRDSKKTGNWKVTGANYWLRFGGLRKRWMFGSHRWIKKSTSWAETFWRRFESR